MKTYARSLGAGALVATLWAPAELGVTRAGDDRVASGSDAAALLLADRTHEPRAPSCASVTVLFAAERPPTYCP